MEILPGIHRIDNVRGSNSYLTLFDESIAIIDTGSPGNSKKILTYINNLGRNPRDVKYIILTHADIDHTGNVLNLKKITGAQVAAHEYEVQNLRGGFTHSNSKGVLGVVSRMRFLRFRPINVDKKLKDSDEIAGLKVIYTPGHTKGSICLYHAPDALFIGDIIRINHQNNPEFSARAFTWDDTLVYQSLQKISELSFHILLPGHGEPLFENSIVSLKQLLQTNS